MQGGRRRSVREVLEYWRLPQCRAELRIRRIKMDQRWFAKPKGRAQEVAAVFCSTKSDIAQTQNNNDRRRDKRALYPVG